MIFSLDSVCCLKVLKEMKTRRIVIMLTITILFIRNEKRQKELGLQQIYNLKKNRPMSGGAAGLRVSTAGCSGQTKAPFMGVGGSSQQGAWSGRALLAS